MKFKVGDRVVDISKKLSGVYTVTGPFCPIGKGVLFNYDWHLAHFELLERDEKGNTLFVPEQDMLLESVYNSPLYQLLHKKDDN